jgi:hypothetical protein
MSFVSVFEIAVWLRQPELATVQDFKFCSAVDK